MTATKTRHGPKITLERREGRVTLWSYRVVVTLGSKTVEGPWGYTQRQARLAIPSLLEALRPSEEESEAILAAESQRRCRSIRQVEEVSRKVDL